HAHGVEAGVGHDQVAITVAVDLRHGHGGRICPDGVLGTSLKSAVAISQPHTQRVRGGAGHGQVGKATWNEMTAAKAEGCPPATKNLPVWKVPSPLPSRIRTVPEVALATAMSMLWSPLKSPTANASGPESTL